MRAWKTALSALVVLSLLPACHKLGLGGSKDEDSDDDDAKKKKKKKKQDDDDDTPAKTAAPPTATPATAAPAVAPPAAGGSSGIPECDAYLAKYVQCFPGQEAAAEQMRSAWRLAVGGPAQPSVAQSCTQMLASMNCAGALAPPIDAPPPVVGGVPPPVVAPPPGGRSAVPSLDEWNAQTKEVAVTHSSKLNCETKMVREWLRVSCRGKNFSGGTPTGVTVTRGGGRGDEFAFAGNEVASLVVRFVEGVDLEARFTWTDRSHVLRVFWPRGAPEPPPKGEFLGL
jgi:hypothetical protein